MLLFFNSLFNPIVIACRTQSFTHSVMGKRQRNVYVYKLLFICLDYFTMNVVVGVVVVAVVGGVDVVLVVVNIENVTNQ